MATDDELGRRTAMASPPSEEQCIAWFLRIEDDLHLSSLTFEAVQWALASLQSFLDHPAASQFFSSGSHPLSPSIDVGPLGTCGDGDLLRRSDDQAFRKDASVDDEALLAEKVRICDMGEAGANMATVIRDKLGQFSFLVQLINQCVLLSLDQVKPSQLDHEENDQEWLLTWMLQNLLSGAVYNISWNLDWLLAYLSAVCTEHFFVSLFHIIAAEFLHHSANQTVVPLSTLVRIACILEYVYSRHGERAALSYLCSYQLFTESATDVSKRKYPMIFHKLTKSMDSYLIGFWLVMGFLCPHLFSSCVNLLASSSDLALIRKWWLTIQEFDYKIIPLSNLSKILTARDSDKPDYLVDWFCTIFQRHLIQLITTNSDVVLVLTNLYVAGAGDEDTDSIARMAHSLLKILSNRVYVSMLQRISGSLPSEMKGSMPSVLENIEHHLINLWTCLLNDGSAWERHAEDPSLYGHPIMEMCLMGFLCSPAEVTSQVLVYSMGLVFSIADNVKLRYKLGLLFKVMQSLANKSKSELVFELWAVNFVNQVFLLNSDQAYCRIVVVANLLQLSHETDLSSGSSLMIQKCNIGSSIPMYRCLVRALSKQWLRLLGLLHWNNACELKLAVVSILQFLPPGKFSNVQDNIYQLKSSLGLLLHWLDGIYCCKASKQNSMTLLGCSTETDEKWRFIRLIEKFKIVIVRLAACNEMFFTLMVNSIMEYSFSDSRQSFSEFTSDRRRKLSVSLPSFSRFNRFGKRSPQPPKFFPTTVNNLNLDHCDNRISEGSNLRDFCSIISHLANLLRLTVSHIDNQGGQTSAKTEMKFRPTSVLTKLLMNHYENFHGAHAMKEQFEEAFPSCQRTFLSDNVFQNRLIFEILEVICENGNRNEALDCIGILKAFLEHTIAYWRGHAVQRIFRNNSSQTGDESERAYVCRLIHMISRTGWINSALTASAEIISLIDQKDILDILLLIWSCLCNKGEKATITLQETVYADNGSRKDLWEDQYHSILRRNVALIGPHFSQLYTEMNL